MALFSVADIVTAIFLLIAVAGAVVRRDGRKSSQMLTITMVVSVLMVLLDSLSGYQYGDSTPSVVLYLTVVCSALATKGILMSFYCYCYWYFAERTRISKWLFIVPMILLVLTMVAQAVMVFLVDVVTLENGAVVIDGSMHPIIKLASVVLPLYLPVLALIKRKEVGLDAVLVAGAPAVFGILISFIGLHDFGTCAAALVIFFTYVFLQNGIYSAREHDQKILEDSNAELEALNKELEERQAQLEESTTEQEAQLEEITALNSELEERQTQLEEAQEALCEARDAANAANEAKTSFLFNMSHDIRTPMNAIIGFTDLIEKHYDDRDKCMDYLHKTQEANKFLLSLINNVLEMARIDSGKEQLDETPCSTGVVTKEIISIFEDEIHRKGITLTSKVDIKTPYMLCDQPKLREICLNILSNAVKYTPEGGSIAVQMLELPCERPGYATIRGVCADTGIGMSEEFLPQIFEEFTRARSATESKQQGTGLGMPIVKKLVDLMGGTIEIESEPGQGTTFTVTIDLKIADSIPGASLENKEQATQTDFAGKYILLAEDNDLNAEIAMEILGEAGFQIDRAADGQICVSMLQAAPNDRYDVILMDVQMPNMNGYEATQAIRALSENEKRNIPILAMTANAFEEDKREALSAGMNGHIAKPIEVPELMKALAEVLK